MNGNSLGKKHIVHRLEECQRRIIECQANKNPSKENLEIEKTLFENLFELSPEALIVIDSGALIVRVNAGAEKLFGYSRDELVGKDHAILVPERYTEKHNRELTAYMKQPKTRVMATGLELKGRKKDGTEFEVDIDLGPMVFNNQPHVLAVVRDASRRGQMEDELDSYRERLEGIVAQRTAEFAKVNANLEKEMEQHRKTEEGLDLRANILDHFGEAVFMINFQGDFIYANQAAIQMYGYSFEEFLGINATKLVRPEEATALTARIKSVYDSGQLDFDTIHVHKDGSIMPVHARHTLAQTKYGQFLVSEVRKIALESELRAVFRVMPGIIWTTDPNLRLLSCTGAGIETLDFKTEGCSGKLLAVFIEENSLDSSILLAQQNALAGESTPIDMKKADKKYSGWTAPIRNQKNEIIGTVSTLVENK